MATLQICYHCGYANEETANTCARCGKRIREQPPPIDEPALTRGSVSIPQTTLDVNRQDVLYYLRRIDSRVSFFYWLAIIGLILVLVTLLFFVALMVWIVQTV